MKFEERKIKMKDGRTCVLRPAVPDDAAAMIKYMEVTAAETDFLLRYPDEISYTVESEGEFLRRNLDDEMSVMMAAVVDGEIAGNSSISMVSPKRKARHRCSLAIALYKKYWGLGIGKAMLDYQTEIAEKLRFEQMDLEVVAENTRAQELYKKCGFVESGRRHNALKFADGSYHDEVLMYKEV